MISLILMASCLVAATVAVHCVGLAFMLRWMMKPSSTLPTGPWPITWLLIRIASWLMLMALVEIVIWGLFYLWQDCLPDAESAFYFSGVTYTTLGYGDLVLAKHWRMLGPVEGLTGILMCGLSAGLFFAVVSRIYTLRLETGRR
jgi:hypothetical protein